MPTDRRIVRWVSIAVGALTAVAVVLPPVIYFSLSHQREAGRLEAEVELNAQLITQIIGANPELWSYDQYRIADTLSRRPRKDVPEIRRVLDARGVVVAESIDPVAFPWMTRTLPLLDAGVRVGTIEMSRSVRPLAFRAVLLAMMVLPLSVLTFQVLRTAPLQAIRRSEAALRRERDTAQRYLDVAGVAFVLLDAAGRVALVNRKGTELLGRAEADVLGKDWITTFVEPADQARVASETAAPARPGAVRAIEYAVLRPSGDRRIVSWYFTALTGERGSSGLLGSGVDITTQRMLEERLRHTQKLEAIGQLAAGVAHGFNNLLSTVKGYAALLRRDLPASPKYHFDLDEILAATERAMSLTRSLLTFSRQERVKPERADLAEIVRQTQRLLRPALRDDIALETELPAEPLPVVADTVQIEQVLMNLVTNARDAISGAGRITVVASRVVLDADGAGHAGLAPGPYAQVSVTDTGMGIDPATRARVFEPFFTTKDVDKGTGLGLAIAHGVMKQHRGSITVASEPGHGATFTLLLPLAEAIAPVAEVREEAEPAGGTETLLVAEDDATLRRMLRRLLEGAGYAVVEAKDGNDAVYRFVEHRDKVRLAILDMGMPGQNGRLALDEIRKLEPSIPALFLSGYALDSGGREAGAAAFVQKPVHPDALLTAVRKQLDLAGSGDRI
jgi:PAS domain S-box-containing protein